MEEELIKKLQAETLKHNCLAVIAHNDKRDYITPEDVTTSLHEITEDKVRLDVLEILGGGTGFGVEDESLTAFVAFEGRQPEHDGIKPLTVNVIS